MAPHVFIQAAAVQWSEAFDKREPLRPSRRRRPYNQPFNGAPKPLMSHSTGHRSFFLSHSPGPRRATKLSVSRLTGQAFDEPRPHSSILPAGPAAVGLRLACPEAHPPRATPDTKKHKRESNPRRGISCLSGSWSGRGSQHSSRGLPARGLLPRGLPPQGPPSGGMPRRGLPSGLPQHHAIRSCWRSFVYSSRRA